MKDLDRFPPYSTHVKLKKRPGVVCQEFPIAEFVQGLHYYPRNSKIAQFACNESEQHSFEKMMLICFLQDTIQVEHGLVIPAIAAMRHLPWLVPPEVVADLYKVVTDEGFHAEQAQLFISSMKLGVNEIDFHMCDSLFMRRLRHAMKMLESRAQEAMHFLVNGIVTETRISIELKEFSDNPELTPSVRRICEVHAEDEAIHSSMFRALGKWLWHELKESERILVADMFVSSLIRRNMPDVGRRIRLLQLATGRGDQECAYFYSQAFSEVDVIDEMLETSKPTVAFLQGLGVLQYSDLMKHVDRERQDIAIMLGMLRSNRLALEEVNSQF